MGLKRTMAIGDSDGRRLLEALGDTHRYICTCGHRHRGDIAGDGGRLYYLDCDCDTAWHFVIEEERS